MFTIEEFMQNNLMAEFSSTNSCYIATISIHFWKGLLMVMKSLGFLRQRQAKMIVVE